MLSYMLPVDEKPPPGPNKGHMQLHLGTEVITNGRTSSPISKETSVSSFVSDVTTATASHSSMTPTSTSDKGKPKLVINGGKHQTLKRVSFGSSKGSMVETLIFESPVQEEPEPSPIPENVNPFPVDQDQTETEREKVRVTFFQQSKPQEVDLPDEPVVFADANYMMATTVAVNDSNHVVYNRTERLYQSNMPSMTTHGGVLYYVVKVPRDQDEHSTESGWDNPFRPGGDLSREADEIVELIKGGKPITPTPDSTAPPLPSLDEPDSQKNQTTANNVAEPITQSPKKAELNATPKSVNGNVTNENKPPAPGAVDVKRGTIKPDGEVEHVTIKKKPKCKCCVIQ